MSVNNVKAQKMTQPNGATTDLATTDAPLAGETKDLRLTGGTRQHAPW